MIRSLILDLIGLGGVGVLLLGVHRIFPPAALILGGLILIAIFVLASARPKGKA